MTRIRILPENLTNKIAAGEVVERPASVVKELVENSLDSGCDQVTVEIESGGKRLIRVTDNGSGMTKEDALLALERHATSKIASDSDLFELTTLGFRGEALPSVASVSRFTLATRERGRIEGTEIYAEGGRIREVKACGMAEGTVVTVRNLFFNTPARLKFLKSSDTEGGHVGDLLTRLALSRPTVRFTFINDGRTVFRLLDGTLQERVSALLGRGTAGELYPVDAEEDGVSVTGLIARPECSRSAASSVFTYINGRFIRDKVVNHAILQAYRNFLERGRYPVTALFIEVPPSEVDVNVHPTKHEVRFREQGKVHDHILRAVEGVLSATPWLKQAQSARPAAASRPAPFTPLIAPPAPPPAVAAEAAPSPPPAPVSVQEPLPSVSWAAVASVREALERYAPAATAVSNPAPFSFPRSTPAAAAEEERGETPEAGYFGSLAVIGQFNAAYILCQEGSDLIIIDQHAAHERVAFESLKAEFAAGAVESQGLLFPETLDLSFSDAALIREHGEELSRLGFELEPFGGTTWLLKSVPRIAAGGDPVRLIRDMLEELAGIGKSRSFSDLVEEVLSRIACHSVVRGKSRLSPVEIAELFRRMDQTPFSSNCPHGRPVSQRLTLSDIEKMFKRL